jgi:hypothetical protein
MRFYLFPLLTGICNGKTIEAKTMKDAENIALSNGLNIYDDFGLTSEQPSGYALTNRQVIFNNS